MKDYDIEVDFSGYSRGVATATVKAESKERAREMMENCEIDFSEMTMRDDREYDYEFVRINEKTPS